MAIANDVRSLRFGLRVSVLALASCVIAIVSIPYLSSEGDGFQCIGKPYIGGTILLADLIWTCPDLLRTALVSTLCAIMIFAATGAGYRLAIREKQAPIFGSFAARMTCVGLTVGSMFLIGTYVSEYSGGQGKLNPAYVFGAPLLVSFLHYPRKLGLMLGLPALILGFFGVVLISAVTGIPLD